MNKAAYSSTKLEFLAKKWVIAEKFRDYLLRATFTRYSKAYIANGLLASLDRIVLYFDILIYAIKCIKTNKFYTQTKDWFLILMFYVVFFFVRFNINDVIKVIKDGSVLFVLTRTGKRVTWRV